MGRAAGDAGGTRAENRRSCRCLPAACGPRTAQSLPGLRRFSCPRWGVGAGRGARRGHGCRGDGRGHCSRPGAGSPRLGAGVGGPVRTADDEAAPWVTVTDIALPPAKRAKRWTAGCARVQLATLPITVLGTLTGITLPRANRVARQKTGCRWTQLATLGTHAGIGPLRALIRRNSTSRFVSR